MKKIKRILAMAGIVLLVVMYLATLACAILDTSTAMLLFRASVMCTVLVPVLIWGYTVIYRLAKGRDEQELMETLLEMDTGQEEDSAKPAAHGTSSRSGNPAHSPHNRR